MHENRERRPLFGTDGVRGTVGHSPLVPEEVMRLGCSYGTYLAKTRRRPTVLIGRDTRISGQMLLAALAAGILQSGATVIDAGILPTPGVAFLMAKLGADGGVVISASHNPAEENGIKFFDASGAKLSEGAESSIADLYWSGKALTFDAVTCGRTVEGFGLQELYLEDLVREHEGAEFDRFGVVLDCANGAASRLAPEAFGRLGCKVSAIHSSPTGTNINVRCGSEHARRYPQDLARLVQTYEADFGVAFDGDADRVIFVDKGGMVIDGDFILGLMAVRYAKEHLLLGNSVVSTIMRNEGLCRFLGSQGLHLLETPVGDKYVTDKLLEIRRKSDAPTQSIGLGGEQAGHIVLLDEQHITGDGLRTALHFISAYAKSGAGSLRDWARGLRKTPQVIASAYVGREPEHARWPRSEWAIGEAEARRRSPALTRASIRYSGTEPLLRVMLEADESCNSSRLASEAYHICASAQDLAGTRGSFLEILDCAFGGLLTPDGDLLQKE